MSEEPLNSIAIITGGNRGIGRAISVELAKSGFEIWITYKSDKEKAEETKSLVEETGVSCRLFQFDISVKEEVKQTLGTAINELDKDNHQINVLVNNAGIIRDSLFYWMKDEAWEEVINTDLNGFFYVTKCVVENMIFNNYGVIINISSISGEIGNYGQSNYSAAKAGVIAATKSLAKELGRTNIRVNAIAPGIIETDMTHEINKNQKMKKQIPLKRFGTPQDVADLVSFLCSEKASYITGAIIPITGGLFF